MRGRIIIGGDVVPTAVNVDSFISGDVRALIGDELKEIFDRADFRVFNLEVPLTDSGEPILKSGPNLIAPRAAVNGYVAIGIDALSLSNNHTLDQGKAAFSETMAVLSENGIEYFGGGKSEDEVKKPLIIELCSKRIGVISFCEHEFSWFDDYGIGARGFDPLVSLDEITETKGDVDYLVVMYHGGREHYRYPSPELRRICRKICEHGADLVLCQHSHCVGAEEEYRGSKIVYGQGNALFAYEKRSDPCWFTGLISELVIEDGEISLVHYPIERHGCGVRLSHDPEIINGYSKRSEEIKAEGFVEAKYSEIIKSYAEVVGSHIEYFSRALELGYKGGAVTRNLINCAPHRELLVGYLNYLHDMK